MKVIIGHEAYCDYDTIQEGLDALMHCPFEEKKEAVILAGDYYEYLECRLSHAVITGIGCVRIVGERYAQQQLADGTLRGTFRSATVFIEGEDIVIDNLTIENTAGQEESIGQAVALFNCGHHVIVKNCSLRGYQDTLCTGPLPAHQKDGTPFQVPVGKLQYDYCQQEYQHCLIEGTIDFIFGGAAAVFSDCQLHSRRRLNAAASGFVTAASTPEGQAVGYRFVNCWLSSEQGTENVFLGRPWRPHAQTEFTNCYMGSHIAAVGWDDWQSPANQQTAQYRETDCSYAGITQRPPWVTIIHEKAGEEK